MKANHLIKKPASFMRFAGYAIPIIFLVYILYSNYNTIIFPPKKDTQTYAINVGSPDDMSGIFHLEPSAHLGERETASDKTTFRRLNGFTYATFKPNFSLNNLRFVLNLEGENVETMPIEISDDYNRFKWDYSWDFTEKIPESLEGNATNIEDCASFDGESSLELPDSASLSGESPLSIYISWQPENHELNTQQIIGHSNWRLLQNAGSVTFQIGQTNSLDGSFYSVMYPVSPEFFDKRHTALAIYALQENNGGYIDLYIDEQYTGRTYFNDLISSKSDNKQNLLFGKSESATESNFQGCIYDAKIVKEKIMSDSKGTSFRYTSDGAISFPIIGRGSSTLQKINLYVEK